MKELRLPSNWFAGIQWLFFIFSNIIVIPITIGAAFSLSQEETIPLIQLSFIVTGIACILQAFLGHQRAIMEGQSGLWWGVILTVITTASAQGVSMEEVGGSLTVGVLLSGGLTVLIGLAGWGPRLALLFNSSVMGVFMFLFGCQLIGIFMKGMLGIPFGQHTPSGHINVTISLLSILIAIFVMIITVKAPAPISRYSLLIGIIVGWILYEIIFKPNNGISSTQPESYKIFPLGSPTWNSGIIITAVLTGILNTANTFGALKGTDEFYGNHTTKQQYRASFTLTGISTCIAALFGLVPYAPYVSSIGFLKQTAIYRILPFALGGAMFLMMGVIPIIGQFFSLLPLSVGSAVLFVAYLQLLGSSWNFFKEVEFSTMNVYRLGIPIFCGIIIMTMPEYNFESLPETIQPLISNGLLVGILLSLLMENVFKERNNSQKSVSNDMQVKVSDEGNKTQTGR
ncbi:uracil/xanthine transporter [Virgibacillus halodenitrificans]|uniref:uracil/xanthine transporter n=1 Tax=Virgibacillus halodenitrificans TaxID=1482 RepID=UPI001371363F|nr:uracil/xanthine transporter [Virgibacillus halodenitrificans]